MEMPEPTPIYRIVHLENLPSLIERQGLYAPNNQPNDGRAYRVIHNEEIQEKRRQRQIPCGPRGVIHDYVSFYLGPRSPMLYQLHTGWVKGHKDGQESIIYLESSVQRVSQAGLGFVFSDGHGIAAYTKWFDDPGRLSEVDWDTVYATTWNDTIEHMDRQRRKQAEFLVHRFCPWQIIERIAVRTQGVKVQVESILANSMATALRPVVVRTDWYY